jgi:hypothetical protein
MGKIMSGKRHRDNKLPPFVALPWDMLNSKAYKELQPSAAKALPYFLGKVKLNPKDYQRYNQDFSFCYKEAIKYGFATTTFYRIICELMSKGFIDGYDKGGLKSDCHSYNLFKLSRRWEQYGRPDFKVMTWETFQPKPF